MLLEQDPLQFLKCKLMLDRNMVRENGIRAYESLLAIDLQELALNTISRKGKFIWYDMCCGTFNAGEYFIKRMIHRHDLDIASLITAIGVDLDPVNAQNPRLPSPVVIRHGNVVDYPINPESDLITCLKGLKYVERHLQQAPQAVEHWYNSIPAGSMLAFDVDFVDHKIDGISFVEYLKIKLGDSVSVNTTYNVADLSPCRYRTTAVHITKSSSEELKLA